jgi:DmsE family decaheme c-type cytochrome
MKRKTFAGYRRAATLVLATAACVLGLTGRAAGQAVQMTPAEGGPKACMECHDNHRVRGILGGPHFVAADPRTPAANAACEACHGPSHEHTLYPTRVSSIRFGKDSLLYPEDQSRQCLNCHQGDHNLWANSTHAAEDLACVSCHKLHTRKDPVLSRLTLATVCFDCHQRERMELNKPYRHPVREAAITCTNCHDPHGSNGPFMLVKLSNNETCYQCHAEKRGPFVHEHEPVQDDCMNCHYPHGSNHENLLIARAPFLCQQCHSDHSHPLEAYDFQDLPGGTGNRQNRVIGGACVNCHSNIHGSNRPGSRSFRQ